MLGCTACATEAHRPDAGPKAPVLAASQSGSGPARPAESPAATFERIRALIGTAACTDSSQCRTLAIGGKACGGPESYLPWSTKQTSEQELRALGERYANERQAEQTRSGEMSNCRFMPDPGAVCRAGTCQLGSSAGARAE
ncbi:hypothetical protein [Massilia horti]|nr:hypothetical protein [Massilia horti]